MEAKADLRRTLRQRRHAIDDQAGRSQLVFERVAALPEVRVASAVLAFEPVPGEPQTGRFIARLRARGVDVVLPGAVNPDAPIDECRNVGVVIVPAIAYTVDGARLGQGGGWYDRLLSRLQAFKVGVCFAECIVERLPVEPHDVPVDVVVTETSTFRTGDGTSA